MNGVSIDVMPDLGDYNGDGTVDAADYTKWRDTLGQTVPKGTLADGDYSGVIDQGDFDVWKENFGHVTGGGSGAVGLATPEPASIAVAVTAVLGGLLVQRRRRR